MTPGRTETYEDRMERLIAGLSNGGTTPFRLEVVALIQEQARMIVRLENDLETERETIVVIPYR